MRKILIVALVLIVVAPAMFADLQIGGVAMYKGDVATINASGLGLNDFTFGLDARLNLGILQGSVAALYYPADVTPVAPLPSSLMVLTDVGLCIDVLFIRIGAGIGPNFSVALEDRGPAGTNYLPVGVNLKLAGDVNLGSFSVGLVGYYYVDSFSAFAEPNFFSRARPFVGVSALFKLF